MTAPDFVAQTAERMTAADRHQWFRKRVDEFKAGGATWGRFAVDDTHNPVTALVEAWRVRPAVEPPPRFQMTAADDA